MLCTSTTKQVVISSRLFPPRTVARARALLGAGWTVRVSRLSPGKLAVHISAGHPCGDREMVGTFKAALTAAAIQDYRRRQAASLALHRQGPERPLALGDRRINLSFECFGGRVLACLDTSPGLWPVVLRTLGRLRLTRPVVDSTDPIDRVVISLSLRRGSLIEEALREFLGTLREELEGPAA